MRNEFSTRGKWHYDPHQVISKRRLEISCALYNVHESNLKIEKLVSYGLVETQESMEVETPLLTKKGLKRTIVDIIDLDGERNQGSKKEKTKEGETNFGKFTKIPSSETGFQMTLGGMKCAPSPLIPIEEEETYLNFLKRNYEHIQEMNMKINTNSITQLEVESISCYQSILLSTIDFERSQLIFYFTHPLSQSISSGTYFRIVILYVNTTYFPLQEKIKPHRKIRDLIKIISGKYLR